MPKHYQGRHRKVALAGRRPTASLLAAAALSVGVIAGDATALGTAQASAEGATPPAQSRPPEPASVADFNVTQARPIMSTTAMGSIGGAGMVSVGAATASRMSATATAPAKKGTPPPAAAEATAVKATAAKTANKAPERSVGARRGSLGAMAGSPGGGTVTVGLAAARSLDVSRPVTGARISSRYGPRWGRLHAGMDFAGPVGTPLRSVGLGVVTFAGPQGAYGNKVEVTLYDGTEVHYGHMQRISVKVGDQVTSGQRLGTLGNTGRSTGPHLHLEVRPGGGAPINPEPWLKERGLL